MGVGALTLFLIPGDPSLNIRKWISVHKIDIYFIAQCYHKLKRAVSCDEAKL
jgi:hypothetical protein